MIKLASQYKKPFILFSLAIFATFYASSVLWNNLEAKAEERFNRYVLMTEQRIEERMETYLAMLRSTAGMFSISEKITAEEFKLYTDQLQLDKIYPGIQGIGYSEKIPAEKVSDFEKIMRKNSDAEFRVWPGMARDIYHSIVFLEPSDERNKAAIGYDMFTEPKRRAAMEKARDTGSPAATEKVILVQEIDKDIQSGFLIYLPIYKSLSETVFERRENLQGFVYSPFRMGDLLTQILGKEMPKLNYSIYNGHLRNYENLMFRFNQNNSKEMDNFPRFHAVRSIDVAGQTWTIEFTSNLSSNLYPDIFYIILLLLVGLIISSLIWGLTLQEIKSREKTAESERLFRHVFDFQFQFMTILSPTGEVREINKLQLEICNISKEDIVGKLFWETPFWSEMPEMKKKWPQRLKEADHLNKPVLSRDEFQVANGSKRITDAATIAVKNEKGDVRFFIVQATDITDRLKAEAETVKARNYLEAAINTSLDAVIIINEKSQILEWNPQAENIFGWKREEALGQSMSEMIIPPAYRDAHHMGMTHFLKSGENNILGKRIELSAINRKGEVFPVELTVNAQTKILLTHSWLFYAI